MARNRKNESGFLPGSVVMALPLLLVLMLLGIGYVWFKDQNDMLGDQVKKKEITLADWSAKTAPAAINWPICACPRPWTSRSKA